MALIARHATPTIQFPSVQLPRLGLRGLGIGASAAFTVLLADALINSRSAFDVWGIKTVQQVDFAGLHQGVELLELLTGSAGAVAAWSGLLLLLLTVRWWLPAAALFMLPFGGIVNEALGTLVGRNRPHLEGLTRSSSNWEEGSFPSGHVQGAVMLYGLLFVIARRIPYRPIRLAVQSGSLGLIATVGIARVWAGAHWPTDVLGAYTLGAAMLAPLLWVYLKLDAFDAAHGRLPLIRAARQPHDEAVPHAHALTSLVRFEGDRVSKVYSPGWLPRAIYWFSFQAPFPYIANRSALKAAIARRNLAGLLTEYWYGERRVARALDIESIDGKLALTGEFIDGQTPRDRKAAKTFLRDLYEKFEAAGLPTWQIDPRQPRAIDNLLETADGRYMVVDLESGLVSPLASRTFWGRAIRRGKVPFFDEVFFDITRDYVAREAEAIGAALGDARFTELLTMLDTAARETAAWQASEPRLWSKLLRAVSVTVAVHRWPARTKALLNRGAERGTVWMEGSVGIWERDGRITPAEATTLRQQIAAPTFQTMLPYLGAHILISVPLRFPLGSIVRPIMVLGALGVATARLLRRKIDRAAWKQEASIHSPLVMVLSGIPGVGSFAYLAAKPVRANRLLMRVVTDSALQKAPWDLYERSRIRRWIARPIQTASEPPVAVPATAVVAPAVAALMSEAISIDSPKVRPVPTSSWWDYGWPLLVPELGVIPVAEPSLEEQAAAA